MLFTNSFALPVALLAGASFAFAQQGGAAFTPLQSEVDKVDPLLKSARETVIDAQNLLGLGLSYPSPKFKPTTPKPENAAQAWSDISKALANLKIGLNAPVDPSNQVRAALAVQQEESPIFSDIINSIVASVQYIITLPNPAHNVIKSIAQELLAAIKLTTDTYYVTNRNAIWQHISTDYQKALGTLPDGFSEIYTYFTQKF